MTNPTLAYVYTRETETDARHAGLLTQDEGEKVARVIARALTDSASGLVG